MSERADERGVPAETFRDELDAHIAESMKDPQFRAAFEDSGARHAILDALVGRRRRYGLTQTEVGRRMGNVRQSTISEFESEPSDPRLSTVQRYARSVGLRLVLVLEEVECVTPPANSAEEGTS
jgi:DNA-binding XRE family transcriptional regulator